MVIDLDKWYLNRFTLIGALLILLAILIYGLEFLKGPATYLFYPLLLGSSEGKVILFFIFMGSLLLLNGVITSGKIKGKFALLDIWESRKYLKYAIALVLITYLVGILIEIWLRINFGVSLFTVFVSLNPDVSSTSIIHSHVFKSALGSILNTLGTVLPSNIHTGESLSKYISPVAYLIVFTLPLVYLTSLISMDNRPEHNRIIIAFAASLAMIGMIDGGLFSNPGIIGLGGLIGMLFVSKPFKPRELIKPAIIVLVIIILGLSVEVAGSNQDYHQITLINQTQPVDWNGYDVISEENGTVKLTSTQNDKANLITLFSTLKDRTDAFFITWNFYSYT
ncbi:MAG: hypothetical protein A4E26_01986 [Methanobacterium sp. PtaU1.Bin097]|nr:MAG: hypothetical protein A4E26_01986 [Methanobacterium sp. PtaU1.Bin097]